MDQSTTKIKFRGQAMMEFALALPILLTLLYGMLETGRLLFIYSSTITAARQAVRYGSATGPSADNVTPLYQDCEGIRAAANKLGFINTFDSITISYDRGLNSSGSVDHIGDSSPNEPDATTPYDPDCGEYSDPVNGDRIVVEVTTQWEPIVPIVPLKPFTITSKSERTIFAAISINVTAVPQNTGVLKLTVSRSSTSYNIAGGLIGFTFTLTNSDGATAAVNGPFNVKTTINGNAITVNCAGAPASLAIGASYTCIGTYSYTITQSNMDAGSFTSSSVASATGVTSAVVTKLFTAIPIPKLALSITPNSTVGSIGTVITFTYTLTNIGNVSLKSPYTVTIFDSIKFPGVVNCSGVTSPLLPGASSSCQVTTYTIKDVDIKAESVVNTATASAMFGLKRIDSAIANGIVLTPPLILSVSVSSTSDLFQVLTFTYRITNNSGGDLILQGVTDIKTATVSSFCNNVTIVYGDDCSYTETHLVTTPEYDLGTDLVREDYASAATSGNQELNSNTVITTSSLQRNGSLSISINPADVTASQPGSMTAGITTVTFNYSLTNTGNVTLKAPFTIDNGAITTCGAITSLAPLTSAHCPVVYPVSQSDIDAGSFIKTAKANGYSGDIKVTSASIDTKVISYSGARFNLNVTEQVNTLNNTIVYTYKLTNTGSVALSKPYTITSSLKSTLLIAGTGGSNTTTPISTAFASNNLGYLDCGSALSTIDPGESTNCSYTYLHPSGTGSSTIENSSYTATINGTSANLISAALPASTIYNCTTSNFIASTLILGSGNEKDIVSWTISNKVGITLTISSITINWATGHSLDNVQINNGSSLTLNGIPDPTPSYTSGSGLLTGLPNAASVTTIIFDFSGTQTPASLSANITIASPYGNCSRSQ